MVVYPLSSFNGGFNTGYRIKAAGGGFTNAKSIKSYYDSGSAKPKGCFLNSIQTQAQVSNAKIGTMSGWFRTNDRANVQNSFLFELYGFDGDDNDPFLLTQFAVVGGNAGSAFDTANAFILFGQYIDISTTYSVFSNGYSSGSGPINANDTFFNVLVQVDTTQATAANRIKIFVNGSDVTQTGGATTYPPQNSNVFGATNATGLEDYGQLMASSAGNGTDNTLYALFDEIAYFDGQIYSYSDVSSGGAPKDLSGLTFGNKGGWYRFETGTAATVGNDSGPNGINYANGGTSLGSAIDVAAYVDGDFSATVP